MSKLIGNTAAASFFFWARTHTMLWMVKLASCARNGVIMERTNPLTGLYIHGYIEGPIPEVMNMEDIVAYGGHEVFKDLSGSVPGLLP